LKEKINKEVFDIVRVVAFQSIFRLKINDCNNFYFKKFIFDISILKQFKKTKNLI
jgi:hypothetical protein